MRCLRHIYFCFFLLYFYTFCLSFFSCVAKRITQKISKRVFSLYILVYMGKFIGAISATICLLYERICVCVCAGVYMYALTWQFYFKMRGNSETWKFWLGFFLMNADAREFQRNFNFNCNVKGSGIWYLHFGKQVVSVPCCLDKFITSPWQRIETKTSPRGEAPNQKQITRRLRYCLCSYQATSIVKKP